MIQFWLDHCCIVFHLFPFIVTCVTISTIPMICSDWEEVMKISHCWWCHLNVFKRVFWVVHNNTNTNTSVFVVTALIFTATYPLTSLAVTWVGTFLQAQGTVKPLIATWIKTIKTTNNFYFVNLSIEWRNTITVCFSSFFIKYIILIKRQHLVYVCIIDLFKLQKF